jgi:Tfp pilus assembly protein PilF
MKAGLINEFFKQVLIYHYLSSDTDKLLFALLKKNIELDPDSAETYGFLAWIYAEHGQKNWLFRILKKC